MKSFKFPIRLSKATPSSATPGSGRPFDVGAITQTIQRALSAAGLNTQTGPMKDVTDTINRALSAAGLIQQTRASESHVIDGVAREIDTPDVNVDDTPNPPPQPAEPAQPGNFVTRSFSNHAGMRHYKLYVPASYSGESANRFPMIVMLHGCTQSPDDFAAGTRMNELAERHGFLVVYPAQAADANGAKCWNWFRCDDQNRDRGEPSLIAGITREVASTYHVDERRIFVAGMSAGAAMAVVLGATYPDLYSAVGAHSGLAYGVAQDLPSALRAMQGSGAIATPPERHAMNRGVPTIVFHGDHDQTVNARNATAIVEQAIGERSGEHALRISMHEGDTSGGRTFTRTVYADAANQPFVEQWVLHGGGHAWSGGGPNGSFTDANGPDASAEMIRFFFSQLRAGTA